MTPTAVDARTSRHRLALLELSHLGGADARPRWRTRRRAQPLGTPARHGHAALVSCRRSIRLIGHSQVLNEGHLLGSLLQLAGTASRPSGRRCALASPAWTRQPLATTRRLRVGGQEQKPAIRAACLKLLERGRDPRGTLAE